jgi:poly(3-hydroxybutyrate) depolymerase
MAAWSLFLVLVGCGSSVGADATAPVSMSPRGTETGATGGHVGRDDGGASPAPAATNASGGVDATAQAAAGDASVADAAGPCAITPSTAQCNSNALVTVTDSADSRSVYWATPLGTAPPGGWPAVVLYQGTGFGPSVTWNVSIGSATPFGGYYQVALVAALLDGGFVVIQPPANGAYWDTNAGNYDTSPDAAFVPALLAAIGRGAFGPIDATRLYATGISSGGYMTSRMAVSYAGTFRALAIESGSYATCLGPLCTVPAPLPANHPPTLFLHGGMDDVVPIGTAQAYYQQLMNQGIPTQFVEDANAGHQWLAVAPQDVVQWFTSH